MDSFTLCEQLFIIVQTKDQIMTNQKLQVILKLQVIFTSLVYKQLI